MGLKEIASRLIAKHGRTIEFLRESLGEPDGFGNQSQGTITAYPALAMAASSAVLAEFLGGFLVGNENQRLLVSVDGLTIVPTTDDIVSVGDSDLSITRVTPLSPDGIPLFYDLQLREE